MWLIGGHNRKVRTVKDGKSFLSRCPACDEVATFREVAVSTSYHVFFVDLFDDAATGVRCSACQEAFADEAAIAIIDGAEPPTEEERVALEERTMARYKEEFEARARARRREEVRLQNLEKQRLAGEAAIDDELAALKRRLGK
jgi:hypothetical protein